MTSSWLAPHSASEPSDSDRFRWSDARRDATLFSHRLSSTSLFAEPPIGSFGFGSLGSFGLLGSLGALRVFRALWALFRVFEGVLGGVYGV